MADTTLLKDGNGYPTPIGSKAYITATAANQIKTGPGFLYSITFNTPTAGGTLSMYDSATGVANPFGVITSSGPDPVTLEYNLEFLNGLHLVPGVAAQDITVVYR